MNKVLIVEDEEFILEMYRIKFMTEGFDILTASDGQEGFDKAVAEQPELILLDVVMPKVDGFQALTMIKKDDRTKNIKTYILSNLGQQEEIDKGLFLGADGFLVKASMTPSELVGKVREILSQPTDVKAPIAKTPKKTTRSEKPKDVDVAKILLIEDDKAIADMYETGLHNNGYAPTLANNGAWGLKMAQEQKFDIIIMDMNMPAMNGYEMLQKVKAESLNQETHILVLSNSAQDEDIAMAKSAGADQYLLKATTTPKKLADEIKKIVK